jgi:hypothetical protein
LIFMGRSSPDFKSNAGERQLSGKTLCAMLVASALLFGCGGGGGGGATSDNGPPVAKTLTIAVTPFKGAFTGGTVTVEDANRQPVNLLSGSGTFNGAVASIIVADSVVFPLTISVTGTYFNEVTGGPTTTVTALRSMVPDAASAATGVPVTALTEIAASVVLAQVPTGTAVSAALVKSTLGNVANGLLGLSYQQAWALPVFDAQGKTSDPQTLQIAALAIAANAQGGGLDLVANIKTMAQSVAAGGVTWEGISQAAYDAALASANGGAGSLLPAGTSSVVVPANAILNITLVGSGGSRPGGDVSQMMVWDQATSVLDGTSFWR